MIDSTRMHICTWSAGIALVITGCGQTPSARQAPGGFAPLDDGQIAEIADAMDTQQIETARLAVVRASDPDTRAFAKEILSDEDAARRQLLEGYSHGLRPSILIELFDSRARAARAWMSNENGASFDRDFLGDQVKEQTRRLDWLDHILIPGVQDPALRDELRRQRVVAVAHLATAQRLAQRFAAAP